MHIYLLGIAGTGMGSFAGLLKALGHDVSGSDDNVYPPMSDKLRDWGIPTLSPYRADNLWADGRPPDLAVVGNVIRAQNPEATELRRRGIPHLSFPEALEEFFLLDKHAVVVAGTHGKTTTTSMLARVLHHAGRDPSLLVGGVPLDFGEGFRLGHGPHFVLEGDEYDTAYFDKGPKFLHYRPRTAIVTGAEFDHADIYRDLAHYETSFEKFCALLPVDGYLAACTRFDNWKRLAAFARCRVETYSVDREAMWGARSVELGAFGARFDVTFNGVSEQRITVPVAGRHNLENALGVWAACRALGLTGAEIAAGLAAFSGVKRRQEVRGEEQGVLVLDDFAHHPTAVRETIAGIASRWPGRRLVAVFEPRSNTAMRQIHQAEYAQAFAGAAECIICQPSAIAKVPEGERVDASRLVADIAHSGTPARLLANPEAIVAALSVELKSGDLVLGMSNGGFSGFHGKLLSALRARKRA